MLCLGWLFCSVSHFLGNLSKTDYRAQAIKLFLLICVTYVTFSLFMICTQMFLVSLVLTWLYQKWIGADRRQHRKLFCKNRQFPKTHVSSFLLFSYGRCPSSHPFSLTVKKYHTHRTTAAQRNSQKWLRFHSNPDILRTLGYDFTIMIMLSIYLFRIDGPADSNHQSGAVWWEKSALG